MSYTYLAAAVLDAVLVTINTSVLVGFLVANDDEQRRSKKSQTSLRKSSTSHQHCCKTSDGKTDIILISGITCIIAVIIYDILWTGIRILMYLKYDWDKITDIIHVTYLPAITVLVTLITFMFKRAYDSFVDSFEYALSKTQVLIIVTATLFDILCFITGYSFELYQEYSDDSVPKIYSTVFLVTANILFASIVGYITFLFCSKLLQLAISRQSMAVRTTRKVGSKSNLKKSSNSDTNININSHGSTNNLSRDKSLTSPCSDGAITVGSNSNNSKNTIDDLEEVVSLSHLQTTYIQVISKLTILSVFQCVSAIVLLSWTLITLLTHLAHHEKQNGFNAVEMVILVLSNMADSTIVVCICLSFNSVRKRYTLLCGKCHHCVWTCCENIAIRKIVKKSIDDS